LARKGTVPPREVPKGLIRPFLPLFPSLLSLPLVFFCSHVNITRADASHPDEKELHFSWPQPYRLVRLDENDASPAQIVSLPGLFELHPIEAKVGVSSVDAKATLEAGGKLTRLGVSADPQIAETRNAVPARIAALRRWRARRQAREARSRGRPGAIG